MKDFDVENWFAPFVKKWLDTTNEKWLGWVENAVRLEKVCIHILLKSSWGSHNSIQYEPTLPPNIMSSTSVVDLFQTFNDGLEFIERLGWEDSVQKDRLVKDFIKVGRRHATYVKKIMLNFSFELDDE